MRTTSFAMIGIAVGAVTFLMALVHFWAGPFAPQPTLETTVAEAAVEIRDATVRALRGEDPAPAKRRTWDLDDKIQIGVSVLGGLAIILAVIGMIKHEPKRQVAGAAALGVCAITFQILSWFAIVLFAVILISAVLQSLDFDIG